MRLRGVRRAAALVLASILVLMLGVGPVAAQEVPPPDDPPPASEPPPEESPPREPPDPGESRNLDELPVAEDEVEFDPTDPEQVFRSILFPVVGASSFFNGFGDCRDGCTRTHNGIDIMTFGWKGVPVVASHDGRVIRTVTGGKLAGCAVVIQAADGWTSHYAHLNTDLPGTDVEGDLCFAPGIEVGAEVRAGTILGWVGDSGNAENTPPHLHFEIRTPEGIPVDAWHSLIAARHIDYQLVNSGMLAELISHVFQDGAATAFVVSEDEVLDTASLSDRIVDAPLLTIDPTDVEPTIAALRGLDLDRVVVLSNNPRPDYLESLEALAVTVEVTLFPEEEEPAEGLLTADAVPVDAEPPVDEPTGVDGDAPADETGEPDEPSTVFEAIEPTTVVVIAGLARQDLEDVAVEGLLAMVSTVAPPSLLGEEVEGHPGPQANRDLFWWPSPTGWLVTTEIPDPPPTSIAYVPDSSDEATIAFLTSRSTAPPTPLWHYQPTSRTIKSL